VRVQDKSKKKREVLQILDGVILNEFKSLKSASEIAKVSRSSISYCCKGVNKTAGGFIWRYK